MSRTNHVKMYDLGRMLLAIDKARARELLRQRAGDLENHEVVFAACRIEIDGVAGKAGGDVAPAVDRFGADSCPAVQPGRPVLS